jgi:Protein of unknown function (DUF3108)
MRKALWTILGCLMLTSAQADAVVLQPFVATYAVTFRGLDAGQLEMTLRHDADAERYTFETRAKPSTLARLVIGRNALEQSTFEMTDSGIRPLSWQLEDGKNGTDGDGKLTFDWSRNQAIGEYEGKPVDLPLQPGLQDRLSIQLAVSAALVSGKEPGSVVMLNGDRTRTYDYSKGATTQLQTPLGKVETIIYESTRPNSNRVSKVWHAPSLGFVPVRAEQIRKGKVETVMTLVSYERK